MHTPTLNLLERIQYSHLCTVLLASKPVPLYFCPTRLDWTDDFPGGHLPHAEPALPGGVGAGRLPLQVHGHVRVDRHVAEQAGMKQGTERRGSDRIDISSNQNGSRNLSFLMKARGLLLGLYCIRFTNERISLILEFLT